MCSGGRLEQVIERAGVIAKHGPVANAYASLVDDEDAASLERLERQINRLRTAVHAEVRLAGLKRMDQGVGALLQLAPGDRGPHGGGDDGRGQDLVETANLLHDRM